MNFEVEATAQRQAAERELLARPDVHTARLYLATALAEDAIYFRRRLWACPWWRVFKRAKLYAKYARALGATQTMSNRAMTAYLDRNPIKAEPFYWPWPMRATWLWRQ